MYLKYSQIIQKKSNKIDALLMIDKPNMGLESVEHE